MYLCLGCIASCWIKLMQFITLDFQHKYRWLKPAKHEKTFHEKL